MITKHRIPSFTNDGTKYWVMHDNETNAWTCTCPHFVERLSGTGKHCKHITSVLSEQVVTVRMTASMINLVEYLQYVYTTWTLSKRFPQGSGVVALSPLKVWNDIDPVYVYTVFNGINKANIAVGDLLQPDIKEIGPNNTKVITLNLKG